MAHSANYDLRLFLDRLLARSVLTTEEQDAVLALPFQVVHIERKRDFVHMNEEITYSCFVASGLVGRYGQTMDGKRQITAFHIAGDMADLHSAVRPVGVGGLNALSDSVILRIPHAAIRTLTAHYPAIAEAFWRDCMLDAAILMQWVINVGRRDSLKRLAHIFCEMSVRSGHDREVLLSFDMAVTQEQLGDAAALTPVHVNRSLKALGEMVTLKNGRVTIEDWDKLSRLGEFDATYLTADTGRARQKRRLTTA
jgi:CRP-like cAMP-binding protein